MVGPQMDIEILGFLGLVFSATSLAAIALERRADVLHGSYVEDRQHHPAREFREYHPARQLWAPSVIDRLRWRARDIVYFATVIAC